MGGSVGGGGGGGNEGIEVTGIRGGTGPLRFMAAARAAAAAAAAADEGSAVDVVGATAAAGGCSGASAGFSGVDLGLPTLSTSEALGLDSRLKSGTGVLLFRLFLLPCPNSATSVILCFKFKMATISRHSRMASGATRSRITNRGPIFLMCILRTEPGLFLFTDLLLPPTKTARSVGLPLRRR